jgi:peptidoglycan/xylan/chitin deacetylase (PgdA/CDA1 family)
MKTLIKVGLLGLYKYSGALRVQEMLARWAGRSFLAILLFHRVTDDIPEDGLTVSAARFRRLCRMLRRRFRVVPLAEVFRMVRAGATLPRRTVAITFDDSYRDNLFAARVLAEHGLPASFFVPTDYIGTDRVFPWDRHLPRLPNLTWDDVREIARLGFEIGSHTVSHADLGAVSAEQARREIFDSKAVIEKQIGRPVRYLAYPFGDRDNFSAEWQPLLDEAGYDGGLSAYGGFVYPGMTGRILPREAVPDFRSNLNLELYLTGCLHWVYALKRKMGLQGPVWSRSAELKNGCHLDREDYLSAPSAAEADASNPNPSASPGRGACQQIDVTGPARR